MTTNCVMISEEELGVRYNNRNETTEYTTKINIKLFMQNTQHNGEKPKYDTHNRNAKHRKNAYLDYHKITRVSNNGHERILFDYHQTRKMEFQLCAVARGVVQMSETDDYRIRIRIVDVKHK